MEPASFLAEPLGGGIDERRDVMVRLALDLGHPLRRRQDDVLADRSDVLVRDGADLGPALERSQLDVEPATKLLAVRPDLGHGRAGVAGDHAVILGGSSAAPASRPQMWGYPHLGPPALPRTPSAEGGYGMALVAELASRWGSGRERGVNVTWFELDLPVPGS